MSGDAIERALRPLRDPPVPSAWKSVECWFGLPSGQEVRGWFDFDWDGEGRYSAAIPSCPVATGWRPL